MSSLSIYFDAAQVYSPLPVDANLLTKNNKSSQRRNNGKLFLTKQQFGQPVMLMLRIYTKYHCGFDELKVFLVDNK